ncbi:MAG: DUF362 domain-containing protein [Acidobacteria bacterium]|nr:DUF362 domain-containing protein [Acidobacteriota bacterium]
MAVMGKIGTQAAGGAEVPAGSPARAFVAVVDVADSGDVRRDVLAAVERAMELADWESAIPRGAFVAVKPNLCLDIVLPGHITSPLVMQGVLRVLKRRAGRIAVVEQDTWTTNVEQGIRLSGIHELCGDGIEWHNLGRGEFVTLEFPDNVALPKRLEVPKILTEALLVTVPVMKTHGNTNFSGAIKNQWGCLKKIRIEFHDVINQALVEINRTVRPRFAVMDALLACEGKGPKQGDAREVGIVLASADNVALDTVACRLMNIPPEQVPHIRMCSEDGAGTSDLDAISVLGTDTLERNLQFRYGVKSLLTTIDLFLHNPLLKPLFYRTPLLNFLVFLAQKVNYPLWMLRKGNGMRRTFERESRFGRQWKYLHANRLPKRELS